MAQNSDGIWSEVDAELPFVITPPLYQRWWSYLLLLCAIAGFVVLAFQLRIRRERRQFALVLQERNRVAREIHDTLAQDFVSISLQLEIISQSLKVGQTSQAVQKIQETRSLVKTGLEAARQSIWNLRANVSGDSLPTRLATSAEQLRRSLPGVSLKIGGTYRRLDRGLEDEVYRIASEALSNVSRHAQATEVLIEMLYGREQIVLTVRDNGRGFSYESDRALTGHYGLRGLEERAATLHARLTVLSQPGIGTTVTLVVPVPETEETRKR
jgi:signal transduction histidine kinase